MARYRRRRRYYKSKGRWSSNIQEISDSLAVSTNPFSANTILVTNPVQSNTTVSQQYTVKNIEATFQIEWSGNTSGRDYIEDLCVYIMYVPQGMTVTDNYNNQHPEYIMNYKFIGSPQEDGGDASQPIRVRTRLSRRLQTGDQIILFVKGTRQETATNLNIQIHGLIRWWTKAN